MLTKASIVTLSRIAIIPIFMWALLTRNDTAHTVALILFIIASATDWVDGFLARKYNEVTDFGKFIDPLADKLLITSAMLIFVQQGSLASWAAMLIIAREFIVTSLRLVAVTQGKVLAAGWSGKVKTLVQIICTVIFILPSTSFFNPTSSLFIVGTYEMTIYRIAGFVMVIVTLWSGVDYLIRHRSVFQQAAKDK